MDVGQIYETLGLTEAAAAGSAPRLTRYRLGPAPAAASAAGEGGEACVGEITLSDGARCIMAQPIEVYGADFLVRRRGEPMPGAAVSHRSFEIVDLTKGEVVVWTAAYFMPGSQTRAFYDIPLWLFLEPRGRCETNGPSLEVMLERFLGRAG